MPFVSYWDNVLDKDYCSMLIDKFEKNIEQQEDTVLENHRSFKEINLNKSGDWDEEINKLLDEIQNTYLQKYMIEQIRAFGLYASVVTSVDDIDVFCYKFI